MSYKHGTYGEMTNSKVQSSAQSSTVAAYVGTAPVNLVRGYANADVINTPVKITNSSDAETKLGKSSDWETYTLCEAMTQHFEVQNVGPVYFVNVLDPDVHRKTSQTEKTLTVASKRAEFKSTTVILDTFAIEEKMEGVDYELSYDFAREMVVVKFLKDVTGTVAASFYEIDSSKVTAETIIGSAANGEYSGIKALELLYQKYNAVLSILAAPGWSDKPAVYAAMISAVTKLNGHWDGFVNADIPVSETANTIEKALEWKNANGYTSERSKVYWPEAIDGSGRVFHLSTIATATMLAVDITNEDVPYESVSNIGITAAKQYFGKNSTNKGFDQNTANTLNEQGITTLCFWAGRWALWGPHTAAYMYNGNMDARDIFDVNIRMLMYITNMFQLEHGTEIDRPMSLQMKESVLAAEREKLDTLLGIGALIGEPEVEFIDSENPDGNIVNGDFKWHINVTNTPPFKSASVRVTYTDDGFQAYFSE